ncbi:hypothetical protein [Rhizobium sp. CF122]|uniref:hypothetical protein n=1 Tax=Rhizobium sp. CF122 TaxID=1144312 RepID=UPI0003194845|nr:hypothetical protein [Rhizobium sp. CF122]
MRRWRAGFAFRFSSLINDEKALDSQLLRARCVRLNYISKGMLAIVPEARRALAGVRDEARTGRQHHRHDTHGW